MPINLLTTGIAASDITDMDIAEVVEYGGTTDIPEQAHGPRRVQLQRRTPLRKISVPQRASQRQVAQTWQQRFPKKEREPKLDIFSGIGFRAPFGTFGKPMKGKKLKTLKKDARRFFRLF